MGNIINFRYKYTKICFLLSKNYMRKLFICIYGVYSYNFMLVRVLR